jgi:hypothetical protein
MKILPFILGLCLITSVIAVSPPVPMPVLFQFSYNGVPVNNLAVDIYLNGEKITKFTNELGKIMVDVGTGTPDFINKNPGTLRVNVLNIDKSYNTATLDTPYVESFSLTTAPPVTCPSCPDCGSCGGGGGGIIYKCTEAEAQKYCKPVASPVPCTTDEQITCPDKTCPTCNNDCPACEPCQICETPTCPEQGIVGLIASIIGGLLVGGTAVYLSFGTGANKLKVYKKNGVDTIYHKHPTITGYHDPNVMHKEQPHKKGELIPLYQKDSIGKWIYKG